MCDRNYLVVIVVNDDTGLVQVDRIRKAEPLHRKVLASQVSMNAENCMMAGSIHLSDSNYGAVVSKIA